MRGYWSSNSGGGGTPLPVGEIDNSKIIGIPPLIYATLNNNLSANTKSFLPINSITYSTAESMSTYWNYQYSDVSNYIVKSLGANFKGFTNLYNILENDNDFKLQFKNPNTDIITSQNVYDVGAILFKFTPKWNAPSSVKTPYASLTSASEGYLSTIQPNLNNWIPIWTGDFGIPWATGINSIATMKQNKHYIGFGKNTPSEETNLLNGNFFNRYHNRADAQTLTDNVFYTEFNSGQLDTNWSIPNPHGCVLRSLWGGNFYSTNSLTDIIQNSSSESGLPFFIDNRGARLHFATGQSFQTFKKNEFKKTNISVQNTFNSLFDNYGYTQENDDNYVVLPKISSNQMVYGGDGGGVLDSPLIDSYVYNNHTFLKNSPSRYMYLNTAYSLVGGIPTYTTNAIYMILTYLKNDVILLSNTTDISYLGHFRINNAGNITT